VEPDDAPSDTIAGRDAPDRPRMGRSVILALVVLLALGVTMSTAAAIHFHTQVTDLQGRRQSATYGASASTTPPQTPTASPASVPASPTGAAPSLSSHSYALLTGQLSATVYLTVVSADGVGSPQGQLLVTALVHGAPGARYGMSGGDCEADTQDIVWARGSADATGTAHLSGDVLTLPKADEYYLTLNVTPAGATAAIEPEAGMNGEFVLGQAQPFPAGNAPCL
jgi:hypothetical protein